MVPRRSQHWACKPYIRLWAAAAPVEAAPEDSGEQMLLHIRHRNRISHTLRLIRTTAHSLSRDRGGAAGRIPCTKRPAWGGPQSFLMRGKDDEGRKFRLDVLARKHIRSPSIGIVFQDVYLLAIARGRCIRGMAGPKCAHGDLIGLLLQGKVSLQTNMHDERMAVVQLDPSRMFLQIRCHPPSRHAALAIDHEIGFVPAQCCR